MSNTGKIARIFEIDREIASLEAEKTGLVNDLRKGGQRKVIIVGGGIGSDHVQEMIGKLNELAREDAPSGPQLLFHILPLCSDLLREATAVGLMAVRFMDEIKRPAVRPDCHDRELVKIQRSMVRNMTRNQPIVRNRCRPWR